MGTVEAYGLALALAIGLVALLGSRGMWLAAAVMLLEWAASNGAVMASDRLDPAEAFGVIHCLCAWLLLRDGRHSAEVMIGGIYLALFIIDGGYLIRLVASGSANQHLFLSWTAGGGWAQIAVLAAGGMADGPGKRSLIARLGSGPVGAGFAIAGAAVAAGVAHAAGSP